MKKEWRIYEFSTLTDEQMNFFVPPAHMSQKNLIIVSADINDNDCDSIIIGEISAMNKIQAEVICKALNEDLRTNAQ